MAQWFVSTLNLYLQVKISWANTWTVCILNRYFKSKWKVISMMDACYCGRAKEGSRYVIGPFSGDQRQMGSEVSRVDLIGKAIFLRVLDTSRNSGLEHVYEIVITFWKLNLFSCDIAFFVSHSFYAIFDWNGIYIIYSSQHNQIAWNAKQDIS